MSAAIKRLSSATPPAPLVDTDPWGDMMAAALKGNAGAYKRLLREVGVWLRHYYARRLPPSMVEDAAQDTLLAVHTRRHTHEPGRPFRPWLAGIARYKWIDRLRALSREPKVSLDDEGQEQPTVNDHGAAVVSAVLLRALLARLKPAQAEAIRLVKLDGFSIEEAALRSGQSVALVKVNIHRGLSKLSAFAQTSAA